jgi:tetratricopeptide (TPR) repeat protein
VPVRHLAFFRAASTEVEGSSEYRGLLAGLVVLRLIDKCRSPARDPELQARESLPVQQAVDAMENGETQGALRELLDSLAALMQGFPEPCVEKLVSYGRLLERDARWDPAADVHLTAIELGNESRVLLPRCYQRAAICFRKLGQLGRVEDLLGEGQRIAAENGDEFWGLQIRLSVASLAMHKGELSEAEKVLEAITAAADASGSTMVAAQARHGLGIAAYEQKRYEGAVEYLHAAVRMYVDPSLKIGAMHDLALALADMGYLDVAKTVFSTTLQLPHLDLELRNHVTINLMHLAIVARDRAQFERLRRELTSERLNGTQLARYHIIVGQGCVAFDDLSAARREFAEAVVTAQAHGEGVALTNAKQLLATSAVPARLPIILDELLAGIKQFGEAAD